MDPRPLARFQSTAADLHRSLIRPTLLTPYSGLAENEGEVFLPVDSDNVLLEGEMMAFPISHKTADLLFPWYRRFASLPLGRKILAIMGSPIWVMLRLTVPVVDQATMEFADLPGPGIMAEDAGSSLDDSNEAVLAEDDVFVPPQSQSLWPPWAPLDRHPLQWHRWLSAINVGLFPLVFSHGISGKSHPDS